MMSSLIRGLACVIVCVFVALPSIAQEVQYMGPSNNTTSSDMGVLTFNVMCEDTYPGSRFCTSKQILDSGSFALPYSPNYQWVHPTVVAASKTSAGLLIMDISGTSEESYASMSCNGWGTSVGRGLVVSTLGFFRVESCEILRPVACCMAASDGSGKGNNK